MDGQARGRRAVDGGQGSAAAGLRDQVRRLRQQVRRLRALYASAHAISASLTGPEVIRRVLAIIDRHFTHGACAILLLSEDGRELVVSGASPAYPEAVRGLRLPVSRGLSGRAVRTGRPVRVGDVRRDPDYVPGLPGCRSAVAIPIRYGDRVLGVLNLESTRRHAFGREDVALLDSLAHHIAVALENARLFEAVQRLAITDPCTGLYNYRHLQERLTQEVSRAQRHGLPLAVVMLDLDGFKDINDRYGHPLGDFVLQELGRLLSASVRADDEVFRYGGDEFVLLLSGAGREEAMTVVLRLLETVRRYRFARQQVVVEGLTFSAGLAVYPEDGRDPVSLLQHADEALYRAKRSGKGHVAPYRGDALGAPAV